MARTFGMPNPSKDGATAITHDGCVVFVGANGSGKSRLGAWIEKTERSKSHQNLTFTRIAAQRMLTFPGEVPRKTDKAAQLELHRAGNEFRSTGDPVLAIHSDYDALLSAVFAAHVKSDASYVKGAKKTTGPIPKPVDDVLDRLMAIWKIVLPHLPLTIDDDAQTISAQPKQGGSFSAQQMSDGERVILYLICHVLLANQHHLILIDEPELHIHQSVQSLLWDTLEKERPDCSFIYITHDLQFAASRRKAVRVLLSGYDSVGPKFDWQIVPPYDDLDPATVLAFLGSRRPTLFVEGKPGGLDQRLYEVLYPDYRVVPVANCDAVIDVVKGLNKERGVHHLEAVGVIDPDDRSPALLAALEKQRIWPLYVAHVENLFAAEPMVRAIGKHAGRTDAETDAAVTGITASLLDGLKADRARLVGQRVRALVRSRLLNFRTGEDELDKIAGTLAEAVKSADAAQAYAEASALIDSAIAAGSLVEMLKVYRNKATLALVGRNLRLTEEELIIAARAVLGDPATRAAAQVHLPPVPNV